MDDLLGMGPPGLINVYCSLIRPCLDYASVVYNLMLTETQSEALERQQRKVLKIIFGWDTSYAVCLERSGLEWLNNRRQAFVEKFVVKLSLNQRFGHWLPKNVVPQYALQTSQKYREYGFRTERLRRAPMYSFRRVLNFLEMEKWFFFNWLLLYCFMVIIIIFVSHNSPLYPE